MSGAASDDRGAAEVALDFVEPGQVIGLGTGRAATAFVRALGARVAQGLRIRAVPTSKATAAIARELDIPLLSLEEAGTLDTTFDGADEVDPELDLIKGYGGALVREKIVAAASRKLVILVGPEKLVTGLGQRGKLPVEVVPFGIGVCRAALRELGMQSTLRSDTAGQPFVTDNGNHILDCATGRIEHAAALDREIQSLPGVLGTGIFAGMASAIIVEHEDRVEQRLRA